MRRRPGYSLLVIRGDGSRAFSLHLPRRVVLGGALIAVLAVSALGAAVGDYVQLRRLAWKTRDYPAELADSRSLIARLGRSIGDLQREAAAWRDLHARIWEAVGPDMPSAPRGSGIGGAAPPPPRASHSPLAQLERLIESVREEGESLRALEALMSRTGRFLGRLPSRWPVRGEVNSEFGSRVSPWTQIPEFHSGLDIGAATGSAVHAPASGIVAFAGTHPEYGLTVVIDHGHDIRTVYGHLSHIAGRPGRKIERGALVGLTGSTGRSSGPHLHYEILVQGRPVNPRAYLWD